MDLPICEAYIRGDLDLEGDLEETIPVGNHLTGRRLPISTALQVGWNLFRLPLNSRPEQNGRQPAKLSVRLVIPEGKSNSSRNVWQKLVDPSETPRVS